MKTKLALVALLALFASHAGLTTANANQCSSGVVVTSTGGTPLINGFGGPVCGS